ncbi:hypothetical protein R6Q59_009974 [Mikania micrantha]
MPRQYKYSRVPDDPYQSNSSYQQEDSSYELTDMAESNQVGSEKPYGTTTTVDEKSYHPHDNHQLREVEIASENDFSVGAVLKGTVANAPTQFERKAALINDELDKFGLGRYQLCIWFLCGFGYFLDLAWAQGVGLTASAIYQEMGVPAARWGDIWAFANAGLALGALSFGLIVDIIGRRWAFNLTCLICSVFGLLIAAPKYNYHAVCGIFFLSCIGLGGNIPIDATIALEYLPQKRRNLVSLLSMWQPVGVVIASVIAYGTAAKYRCDSKLPACNASTLTPGEACCTVSSNMGWRYEIIVLGCMTLAIFFLRYAVFPFHESPKFLLSQGKEAEAIEVLHKIAKFNKAPPPTLTIDQFRAIDEEYDGSATGPRSTGQTATAVMKNFAGSLGHLKALFSNKLQVFIFSLLAVTYMGDYWSFNLAGAYLPIVLLEFNVSTGANSVTETYRQYVYIYLPGILGAFIALFSVQLPLVGRKWSLVFSACCQGLSMAMYTQVRTAQGYVGLNALEYIMQTYFNAVLYASAPELFDTQYRGSAVGMLSCLGRLAGVVAPFAGE